MRPAFSTTGNTKMTHLLLRLRGAFDLFFLAFMQFRTEVAR